MATKQTLLQKAKSITHTRKTNITEEEIELSIAWMTDEVTFSQVMKVLDSNSGPTYGILALSIREAYRAGLVKVKMR